MSLNFDVFDNKLNLSVRQKLNFSVFFSIKAELPFIAINYLEYLRPKNIFFTGKNIPN